MAQVTDDDRARVREQLGAAPGDRLVLVVSKFTQIGAAIPALAAAVAGLPGVRLVIKPHPAETADPYVRATAGAPRVTIAPPALDLASLVASARLLVTVNSTVAIDAMTLGVPTLVGAPAQQPDAIRRGRRHGRASRGPTGATRSGSAPTSRRAQLLDRAGSLPTAGLTGATASAADGPPTTESSRRWRPPGRGP